MGYEEIIRKDLTIKRKEIKQKQLKGTMRIVCLITIVLCIIALCGGFETPYFIDRLVNCVGILVIMAIIGIFVYAYKIFPYRHINPNKFYYEINEIIDKTYRSSEQIKQDYYHVHDE